MGRRVKKGGWSGDEEVLGDRGGMGGVGGMRMEAPVQKRKTEGVVVWLTDSDERAVQSTCGH